MVFLFPIFQYHKKFDKTDVTQHRRVSSTLKGLNVIRELKIPEQSENYLPFINLHSLNLFNFDHVKTSKRLFP